VFSLRYGLYHIISMSFGFKVLRRYIGFMPKTSEDRQDSGGTGAACPFPVSLDHRLFSARYTPLILCTVNCGLDALRETHLLHFVPLSRLMEMARGPCPVVNAHNFGMITDRTPHLHSYVRATLWGFRIMYVSGPVLFDDAVSTSEVN
jgi:hypothetical protein